jgi:hypothetical protein
MARKSLSLLVLAAALTSIGFVQSAPPSSSTTLRLRGTIEKYESATRILSVLTPSGTVKFPLAATSRIRQGWHQIDASLLEKLSGYRADIRYSESGGHKTVESVHVVGKERIER